MWISPPRTSTQALSFKTLIGQPFLTGGGGHGTEDGGGGEGTGLGQWEHAKDERTLRPKKRTTGRRSFGVISFRSCSLNSLSLNGESFGLPNPSSYSHLGSISLSPPLSLTLSLSLSLSLSPSLSLSLTLSLSLSLPPRLSLSLCLFTLCPALCLLCPDIHLSISVTLYPSLSPILLYPSILRYLSLSLSLSPCTIWEYLLHPNKIISLSPSHSL